MVGLLKIKHVLIQKAFCPLNLVAAVGFSRKLVALVLVDHELGDTAVAAHGLGVFDGLVDGHGGVLPAGKDQHRLADVLNVRQGRALFPQWPSLGQPPNERLFVVDLEPVRTGLDVVHIADAGHADRIDPVGSVSSSLTISSQEMPISSARTLARAATSPAR